MKNKILTFVLLLSLVFGLTACGENKKEEKNENNEQNKVEKTDAQRFKEDYESLNGTANKRGQAHRIVYIDEDNPFVYAKAEDIVKKINNKETFYVYFGDTLCPWCRSAIEMAIKVAKENKIDKIYYVPIWDENGNEILRDKYTINDDGKLEQSIKGTSSYNELLKLLDSVLDEYKITSGDDEIDTKEKRIYAPNYIYIEKGKAILKVEGTSDKQKDAREVLTEEMLDDEKEIFESIFAR